MKKRWIAWMAAIALAGALTACGKSTNDVDNPVKEGENTQISNQQEDIQESSQAEENVDKEEPAEDVTLLSSGFEGTLDSWDRNGSVILMPVTDAAHMGEYSLKVYHRGNGAGDGAAVDILPLLDKLGKYKVSVWIRLVEGTPNTSFTLVFEKKDDLGSRSSAIAENVLVTDQEWTELSGEFQCLPVGPLVKGSIRIETDQEGVGREFYIDDMTMVGPSPKEDLMVKIDDSISSLKDVYKDDFYIGTAVGMEIFPEGPERELVKKHFNVLTGGNLMKFGPIHPYEDVYDFAPADEMVRFAEQNGMKVIGHTLVWHSQTSDWVFKDASGNLVSREVLLKRMEDHIKTVVGRYKGRVKGWDVVNEAVDENAPGGLRDSLWKQIIGDDYIEWAFRFAHEADPDAELYYNDYSTTNPKKREVIYNLVKGLKEKGLRVDAIGMQSHWSINYPSVKDIDASIERFSSLGVKVNITELDMDLYDWNDKEDRYRKGVPDELLDKQAERYAQVFDAFKRHSDVIDRVTFWGFYDGGSWLNDFPVKGRTNYPLPFDRSFQAKPAFWAVVNPDDFMNQ